MTDERTGETGDGADSAGEGDEPGSIGAGDGTGSAGDGDGRDSAGDGREAAGGPDDAQYHLELRPGDVAEAVLLPGEPERVDTIADCWEEATVVADHREYRTATGRHEGTAISATSTGIGSPSAAIAVEELARVGCETLVRVGSCGAIQPETEIGDLLITTGAVRQEGTSDEYVRPDYPAVADHAVVAALVAAAEELGYDYHLGVTASTDSFYAGQSRTGFEGFRAADAGDRLDELQAAGVLGFEMETSAILTLAGLYGLRAGAVCTVYADRTSGEFRTADDRRAARVASRAVSLLAEMDAAADREGAGHWHAGLDL